MRIIALSLILLVSSSYSDNIQVLPLRQGPMIKGVEDDPGHINAETDIRLWGRGSSPIGADHCYGVVRYKVVGDADYGEPQLFEMKPDNDNIGQANLTGLTAGTQYKYKMGYIHRAEDDFNPVEHDLDWAAANIGRFTTDAAEAGSLQFIFGSCRRHVRLWLKNPIFGKSLYGTGSDGDLIFRSVNRLNAASSFDFFLSVGDQVYFDPIGDPFSFKTLQEKRWLYKQVFNYTYYQMMASNIPCYYIKDDHDDLMNNSGDALHRANPQLFADAMKTEREFQHRLGPDADQIYRARHNIADDSFRAPSWYNFKRKNAAFWVFDTRTNRTNDHIIDKKQKKSFTEWIKNIDTQWVFVVSPTPFLSQNEDDSWSGFAEDQKYVIKEILSAQIRLGRNIFVLVGDAHCCRTGIYKIINKDGVEKGKITEILSSGFVALKGDRSKELLPENAKSVDYDTKNDFPYTIDNLLSGGYKFVTHYSSQSYPLRNKPRNIDYVRIFHKLRDNTFTTIDCDDGNGHLITRVYNQKWQVGQPPLFEKSYNLVGEPYINEVAAAG
jgi:hypothetical protein